jgi:hypothetical protein
MDHYHSSESHNLNTLRESTTALMKHSCVASSDTSDDTSPRNNKGEDEGYANATTQHIPLPTVQDPLRLGSGAVDHPRLDTVATAPIDEVASRLRERPCRGSLSHGYVNEDLPKSKKLPLDQQQRYHRRREKLILRRETLARKTEE